MLVDPFQARVFPTVDLVNKPGTQSLSVDVSDWPVCLCHETNAVIWLLVAKTMPQIKTQGCKEIKNYMKNN